MPTNLLFSVVTFPRICGGGFFFCPRCHQEAMYQEQVLQKYFCLGGLRLFPIRSGEHVFACARCHHEFGPKTIQLANRQRTDEHAAAKAVLALCCFLVESQLTSPSMVVQLKEVAGDPDFPVDQTLAQVYSQKQRGETPWTIVSQISRNWQLEAKCRAMEIAVRLAQQELDESQLHASLQPFGWALGLSAQQIDSFLA